MNELPDAAYLRECFHYEPESGALTWKQRPREHFPYHRTWLLFLRRFAGKLASDSHRYPRVRISGKGRFRVHRIIWKMQTGFDPVEEIDHKNRNPQDNRWTNLRLATRQDNCRNTAPRQQDLPKGVYRNHHRYGARCTIDNRTIYIGQFATPEEAHSAYHDFVADHYGEFFNGGQKMDNDELAPRPSSD